MLYFITGKPGNGKTLYTIALICDLQKQSGREVYYDGVPLLPLGEEKLQWKKFDVSEQPRQLDDGRLRIWPSVPAGSIVVVDEVQRYWRQRKQGSEVPRIVQAIETHRHFGIDLYFLTQDPQLVDINVRKLVWQHTHLVRRAGLEVSTLYRWNQKVASVENKVQLSEAIDELWKFPKEYYGYYESSESHTAKAQLPIKKFMIIGGCAVFVLGSLIYVFTTGWGNEKKAERGPEHISGNLKSVDRQESMTLNPWSADRWAARVQGRAETAPAFDRLQNVRSQPVPAGCALYTYDDGVADCECRTSQGSVIDMPVPQCLRLVKRGWFDPTKPVEDKKAINIAYLNQKERAAVAPAANVSQTPAKPASENSTELSSKF